MAFPTAFKRTRTDRRRLRLWIKDNAIGVASTGFLWVKKEEVGHEPWRERRLKTEAVYRQAFNRVLELATRAEPSTELPSEKELSRLVGVSRTTIRKVLAALIERGIVEERRGARLRLRGARPEDYYSEAQTTPRVVHVERQFMEWMLRGDAKPGEVINELELARQFGVATTGIREFLNRFQRCGLIEKRPNSGWLFKGFTQDFALELFEIRVMFELRSAARFAALPASSPLWEQLAVVELKHRDLLREIEERFHDFSSLDNTFHRLVNEAAPNRFIDDFYDIITVIFHYHYQWNKKDEKERNRVAISEHLAYIDALRRRDLREVEAACRRHLESARETLIRSLVAAA